MEAASAMPPEVYTCSDFHALEQSRIFAREWLCIGREDSIAKPGDYLTYSIGEQPIFAVRGKHGDIRSFANVCLHRMMRLLEGKGNCKRIVCPYHAWTYDIDGRLVRAPHMERTAEFDVSDYRLPEIRCEVWEGWIFVTLNPRIEPVADRLEALQAVVERYRMSDYVEILQQDYEWNTNWKCLTENFMEGYHLPVAHRASVGAYFSAQETQFSQNRLHEAFTFQTFVKTSDAPIGTAHPDNERLQGRWRKISVLVTIYPSHMFALAPDHLWYLSLQPNGTDKVKIRFGAAFAPEVLAASEDRERLIRETTEFLEQVNAEDRFLVEGIFQGVKGALSKPGRLSWLERENHEFTQYLARCLAGPLSEADMTEQGIYPMRGASC
jgi:choline monooxygenase